MRLTPKAVRAIERGDKTQHRVPIVDPKPRRRRNGTTYISQPFHPTVGQSIPVQPEQRDKTTGQVTQQQVRVVITDVARAPLGDITVEQIRMEGHKTLAEFADQWMRVHSSAWPPKTEALCKNCDGTEAYIDHEGQEQHCEECELGVVEVDDTPTPEETVARFERKHAHHLVWVVTFEVAHDVTRFLNKRARLPPTTSPTEALDPDAPILGAPRPDWQRRAEQRRQEALKARDGARLAGLDRLSAELQAEAHRLALESDADISSLIRQVDQKVDHIRRRIEGRSDQHRRAA